MKLAVITMRPKIGDKKSNLEKIEKYIKKNKADMYVFGEMTVTGYPLRDEYRDYAETTKQDSFKKLKKLAKEHNAYIVTGLPTKDEKVKGLIYNTAVMFHPDGKVDLYNKWFLVNFGPFEEKIFFDEGEHFAVCDTKFGKIGLIICYDVFFPELCKAYALAGCDMIICISASPTLSKKYFETLLPARAVENTVFMVYSNIVGTQENLVFWGGSEVYDPLAKQLVKAPYYKESIITCDIDFKETERARAGRPVLRDIRPVVYNDLFDLSRKKEIKKEK